MEWISVEDRLPTDWIETDECGNGEPLEFVVILKGATVPITANFDGKKFVPIYYADVKWGSNPTHWLPREEPPKEESK